MFWVLKRTILMRQFKTKKENINNFMLEFLPVSTVKFTSLHTSSDFFHLLITFANTVWIDKMSVLIWIQTICHSDSVLERIL